MEDKQIVIVVNGREKTIEKKDDLTYREVVELAFGVYDGNPSVVYTVTYSKGNHNTGSLVDGQDVKVMKEMVFNVTRTDKS